MKHLATILMFLVMVFGAFHLANDIILNIANHVQNHDVRILVIIGLWIVGFSTIFTISVILGLLSATIIASIFRKKKRKR